MRLIVFFLIAGLVQLSAAGMAQTITLKAKNQPLREVIKSIRQQTDYTIFGSGNLLKDTHPINVDVKNMPILEFLDLILKNQPIEAQVQERTIVLAPKVQLKSIETLNQVIQQQEISGVVLNENGDPMAGATVILLNSKGERVGAQTRTDAAGKYVLKHQSDAVTLQVSYLGYTSQKVGVKNEMPTIKLLPSTAQVDDVVVTGYNTIRKESFTGNSISVSQEQLLQVNNRSVVDALQVFDPSFRLEVNNIMGSDPNTLPEFYIRGRSGIGTKSLDEVDISEAALTNNPNLPIFIMDGYEVSAERVYDFDITRIKNITILKDAAATAVYGSRSANGVVVIETVAPQPGKLRVDYNVVTSVALPDLNDYNLMNAAEKLEAEKLAGFYIITPSSSLADRSAITKEVLLKENQLIRGVNTDWLAQPVRNEFNHKHTLNLDGGTENLRFNFLLKYDRQNGVMKESARNRKGGGLGIDYRLNKLQIRNDFTYDIVDATDSPYGSFSLYTQKLPYDEIYGENGVPLLQNTLWHTNNSSGLVRFNPIYEVYNTNSFSNSGYNNVVNNTALIWNFLPSFQLRADLALSRQSSQSNKFTDPNSSEYSFTANTDYTNIGELTQRQIETTGFNSNLFLRYANTIGNHNMNFSGGFNARENVVRSNYEYYSGFPSGQQSSPNFAAKIVRKPNYADNKTRLIGSFIALNYSFKDIYLLDASGRMDGSSEFGSENRVAPFWSLGTGVNIHKYEFMKNQNFINRLRISGTTGELGKTNFPPYAAKGMYNYLDSWYKTGNGSLLIAMESTGLTWEKTKTYDLILDMGMWKDAVTLNFNYYNKITNNLVNDVDIPLSSGFSSYKDNIGKVQNEGFEVQLRANLIRKKDFLLAVYGNYAQNHNELLELSNSLKRYNDLVNARYDGFTGNFQTMLDYQDRYATPLIKYVEGGSLTSIFGMKSLGINPMDGKEIYLRPDGTITYDWAAGDQVIIGDTSPKGQGSFGVNVNYKGFSFFASFLYQYGAQQYNQTLVTKVENVDLYNRNADKRVLLDRWNSIGQVTSLKDIADRAYTTRPTSRFVQDNNYVKMNSLSLGYDVPSAWLKAYKISRLRAQLSSNNVALWSTILQERGTSYPFARNYDLSLKLVF